MKIICDACHTKYSISDDKVAGKVFKIRCKKCSHVNVIRGAAVAVDTPPIDDNWHAVVDNQQIGPFDSQEMSRRRDAGELDDDSYVWREGMTDWAPFGSIEAFRKAEPQVELPDRSPFARPVDAPPSSDATRLRGERNETSVLFTLSNLAKLAVPAPAPTATTSSSSGAPVEGSGLIDIRALASAMTPVAKATPTSSMPDLPVFAASSGFADPIVLVPNHRSRGPSRLVIALVALAAMLVIVTSVLIVLVMKPSDHKPTQVAAVTVPHPDIVAEPPAPPPAVVTPPPAPPPVVPPPPAVASPPASPPPSTSSRRTTTSRSHSTPPPVTPLPQQLKAPENQCDEISCEATGFADRCCDRFKPKPSTNASSSSELPDHLDANHLKAGIATIDVKRCSGKSSGSVSVSVKISPAGAVTSVTIKSSPDTAASECVTAAAKKGTFARSQRGGSFAYLWRL